MYLGFVFQTVLSLVTLVKAATVDYVEQLESSNFNAFIENNEHVLVKFFAPWCVHCKEMAADFVKAASILAEKGSNIKLGEVDATKSQDLAEKYEIKGYPTLLFFRSGVPEDYTAGRQTADIVSWLEKMTGPIVKVIESESELPEFERDTGTFFGVFPDENDRMLQAFKNAAAKMRDSGKFYVLYDGSGKHAVTVYRKDEEPFQLAEMTETALQEFVNAEKIPLFAPISFQNFKNYFDNNYNLAWVCGDISWYEKAAPIMRKIARTFRSEYAFIFLDVVEFRGHAESYLAVHDFPAFVIHGAQGRYIMKHSTNNTENLGEEILDSEKIVNFINKVKNGQIEKHFKSEEIPQENNEPVKTVVGNNFKNIVLDSGKDVMLQVYAPWCGYCKSFADIYRELGEKLKDDDSIIIAKMDGTTNESPVPSFKWEAFPSIYYIKAGETEPHKYQGKRTVEALLSFIESNRTKVAQPASAMSDEL